MQQETPEEGGIICFSLLLRISLCYCEACVLCSECPWRHHAVLPLVDVSAFKASSHPCQFHPSPLSLSFFPSCPQFDLQFSAESFICCDGHLLDLNFTQGLSSLCLWHLSPGLCDLLVTHLCRMSQPVTAWLTYVVFYVSSIPCWPFCIPLLCSFRFRLLIIFHWFSFLEHIFCSQSPLLNSSSSFSSSPCCFLAIVFYFDFSKEHKCNPFWQRS